MISKTRILVVAALLASGICVPFSDSVQADIVLTDGFEGASLNPFWSTR